MAGLTPRKEQFALEYIRTGAAKASAITAGYSPNSATSAAGRLLHDPHVKALIDAARERSTAVAQYTATTAMREIDDAIAFSKSSKNATAYVSALQLKAKLSGLLVDRADVRMLGGFKIEIAGIDDPAAVDPLA